MHNPTLQKFNQLLAEFRLTAALTPGLRVAVRLEGREFFLATIKRVLPNGRIRVIYDDDTTALVDKATLIVLDQEKAAKKVRRTLSVAEMRALKKVRAKGEAPADKDTGKTEDKAEDLPEEARLALKVGSPKDFRAIAAKEDMVNYLVALWRRANFKLFKSALPPC